MIKGPLLLFCLLFINIVFGQSLNLDNNLTGILSNNQISTVSLQYSGINKFDYKKSSLELGTVYSMRFNPKLSENEFSNRINISRSIKIVDVFVNYQYNYSYIRKINSDNWLGIGAGVKKNFDWGRVSLSYATIYQNTDYFINPTRNTLRHSVRFKMKYSHKLFLLNTEYFYQPSFTNTKDVIVFGTTKVSFLPQKQFSFIISDILNYNSMSNVKVLHNLTVGFGYKFNKDFTKKN